MLMRVSSYGDPPPPYTTTGRPSSVGPLPTQPPTSSTPPPSATQIRTPAIPTSFPELEQKTCVIHYLLIDYLSYADLLN